LVVREGDALAFVPRFDDLVGWDKDCEDLDEHGVEVNPAMLSVGSHFKI
jgi:hypothetical protein